MSAVKNDDLSKNEKIVLDCVRRLDDGRGLSASGYYSLYGSWDMPEFPQDLNDAGVDAFIKAVDKNFNNLGMEEAEFKKIMNTLAKKGFLYKGNNGLFYAHKPSGTVFNQLEDAILRATEEQIIGTAVDSINKFIEKSGMQSPQRIFEAIVLGAKVGIANKDGTLNESEKRLTNEIFQSLWSGEMEDIYKMLTQRIREEEYTVLGIAGSNHIGIDYLMFILCFAYIDREWDREVAKRIEECFGMALLGVRINGVTYNDGTAKPNNGTDSKNRESLRDKRYKDAIRKTLKGTEESFTIGQIIAQTDFGDTLSSSMVTALVKKMEDVECVGKDKNGRSLFRHIIVHQKERYKEISTELPTLQEEKDFLSGSINKLKKDKEIKGNLVNKYEKKKNETQDYYLIIEQINTLKEQKSNAEESYRNCENRKRKELEPLLEKLYFEEATNEVLLDVSNELKILADKSILGKKGKRIKYTNYLDKANESQKKTEEIKKEYELIDSKYESQKESFHSRLLEIDSKILAFENRLKDEGLGSIMSIDEYEKTKKELNEISKKCNDEEKRLETVNNKLINLQKEKEQLELELKK